MNRMLSPSYIQSYIQNHIFSQSAYVTCVYNSFWWVGMISLVYTVDLVDLVDLVDVIDIDFMHPHGPWKHHLIASMWGFMLCSCEKLYLKDVNSCYIYWDILHLPNFSNNKLLYIVILFLPFAKYFISVNECFIRKAKTWQYSWFWLPNLHYFF